MYGIFLNTIVSSMDSLLELSEVHAKTNITTGKMYVTKQRYQTNQQHQK